MPSSSLVVQDILEETTEYAELVLHEGAIKGLFANQREDLKKNVALANQAWGVSGSAKRACAQLLSEIKQNTPKGNWTALIKSGNLNFSESVTKDLVAAHDGFLADSSIPDRFLSNISARTLGMIGRCNDNAKKMLLMEQIIAVDGIGFPESEAKKILKPAVKINRTKAGKKAKKGLDANATKEETITYYTKVIDGMQADLDRRADMFKKLTIANQDKAAEIGKLKEQIRLLKANA